MATRVAERGTPGQTDGLLESATCRSPYDVESAYGPPAPGRPGLGERDKEVHIAGRTAGATRGSQSRRRGNAVYDSFGRLQGVTLSILRAGRCRRRHAHRQSQPERNREPDRLLRQYAGLAHGTGRGAQFPRIDAAGERDSPWRVRASRPAFREIG